MDTDTALTTQSVSAEVIEQVVISGDLMKLTSAQRVEYYNNVCKSLKLNPLTKPFDYIVLNGKLRLYATKDASEQLRQKHGVSITKLEKQFNDARNLYIVTAYAQDRIGRTDAATGVVNIKGLAGDNLANALMKAETKSKRRVTLSICGLGWMDESEVETVKDARPVVVTETGDIIDADPKATSSPNGSRPQQPEPTTPKPEPTTPATAPIVTTPVTPVPVTAPAPQTVERTPEMDAELERFFGKEEPPKVQPAPATETEHKVVKIWDGEKWQEKHADEQIKASSSNWFAIKFVGKDKAFGHQKHLFGEPPNNQGHLGKHFGRNNFVDAKGSMTYDQFAALVGYAWYKQGDKEHGYLDPRFYQDKIEEQFKAMDKKAEAEPTGTPSVEDIEKRATKLGLDLVTLVQQAYGTFEKPFSYTELNEKRREKMWGVMDLIEHGSMAVDNSDAQVTMLLVDET